MNRVSSSAIVIGGGLSGAITALELAREGLQSILLERSKRAHHKMCGEFLSSEAIHYLTRHGIDVTSLGAVPIHSVRLVSRQSITERALPFAAYSLTRSELDERLLGHAALAGADVQRGSQVEKLQRIDNTWCASLRDGRCFRSTDAFLATGKHDLRGWPRPAGTHQGLVAFKMYYLLEAQQHIALGQAIELILFAGGYAGLQPVEGGRVNLCFVLSKRVLRSVGANWSQLLSYVGRRAPHLAMRLCGAKPLLDAPLTASNIPYGHMQTSAADRLWRVGDQAAVIPSFCGDGMAIALHSGTMAVRYFLHDRRPEEYQRQLRDQIGSRLAFATRLSQLLVTLPQAEYLVRVAPGLLSRIASMTRIPQKYLLQQ